MASLEESVANGTRRAQELILCDVRFGNNSSGLLHQRDPNCFLTDDLGPKDTKGYKVTRKTFSYDSLGENFNGSTFSMEATTTLREVQKSSSSTVLLIFRVQVQRSVMNTFIRRSIIDKLRKVIMPIIEENGLVLLWHESSSNKLLECDTPLNPEVDGEDDHQLELPSSQQILLSLANSGLIPISSSCRFGANVFAAQLLNQPYSIRTAEEGDLCSLCELDESVWSKPMRYPIEHIKKLTRNSIETIVVESKANNKILAMLEAQRVVNQGQADKVPWSQKIAADSNKDRDGQTIEILRVSEQKDTHKLIGIQPAKAALDFAFLLASAQGIVNFCSIVRTTDFASTIKDLSSHQHEQLQAKYSEYVVSVKNGETRDKGLSFHLENGATLIRKTMPNWIPEDELNQGYGILIQYTLQHGRGVVIRNDNCEQGRNATQDKVKHNRRL